MHISFVRQDLQDNQDFLPFQPPAHRAYAPEGGKAKTLIPLRGNRHFKSWEKQGYRTRNQAMQTVNGFIRIRIILLAP